MSLFGGPSYTFLKHQTNDELIADLLSLYVKLVELGMEYRNGEVYLADLEEKDV
jgi:chemotaxis response regulator CheB